MRRSSSPPRTSSPSARGPTSRSSRRCRPTPRARPRGVLPPLHARDGAVLDGHDRRRELDRLRRRLRAGDGVRLPHRGESATFGEPEINLGLIPGFGGTQRLPRLVGRPKALEMNLTGDPIDAYEAHRVGLANQVVPDHELFDTALALGTEAFRAGTDRGGGDQEALGRSRTWTRDFAARARVRRVPSGPRTRRRASRPSSTKRRPRFKGSEGRIHAARSRSRACSGRLSARSCSPAPASRCPPASRTSARPARASGRRSIRWRSRTSTHGVATRIASGASTASASPRSTDKQPNEAHPALAELERRGLVEG